MNEMTEQGTEQFFPTTADMAEFFEAEVETEDTCRECGGPKFGFESAVCTPCDREQWVVEMDNFFRGRM